MRLLQWLGWTWGRSRRGTPRSTTPTPPPPCSAASSPTPSTASTYGRAPWRGVARATSLRSSPPKLEVSFWGCVCYCFTVAGVFAVSVIVSLLPVCLLCLLLFVSLLLSCLLCVFVVVCLTVAELFSVSVIVCLTDAGLFSLCLCCLFHCYWVVCCLFHCCRVVCLCLCFAVAGLFVFCFTVAGLFVLCLCCLFHCCLVVCCVSLLMFVSPLLGCLLHVCFCISFLVSCLSEIDGFVWMGFLGGWGGGGVLFVSWCAFPPRVWGVE